MRTTMLMVWMVIGCGDDKAEGANDELGQIDAVDGNSDANGNADGAIDDGNADADADDGADADGGETADGSTGGGADADSSDDTSEPSGMDSDSGFSEDDGGASDGSEDVDTDDDGSGSDDGGGSDGADLMTGLQIYTGEWEVRLSAASSGLSPSDDTCAGTLSFTFDFDADPVRVFGEGTCSFTADGLIFTLLGLGVIDRLGPYVGEVAGVMTSPVDAAGTMPVELIEGETLLIDWEGQLSSDASMFTGNMTGSELISAALPFGEVSVPLDYEVEFEAALDESD